MMRFTRLAVIALIAALLLPGISHAGRPWYLGAGAGPADLGVGSGTFDDGTLTSASVDDSDTAWKVFVGYQFGRWWSLEVGYVDFNNDYDGRTTVEGISAGGGVYAAGDVSIDLEPDTTYLAAVLPLYAGQKLHVFGKYGFTEWDADVTVTDANGTVSSGDDGSDDVYGVGFEYRFGSGWTLRAEWEKFGDVAGSDIEMISGGVVFRFAPRR